MADVSLLPVSKAKTAFGLLSEIAKLTLKEPKRMRMDIWGGREHNASSELYDLTQAPACGTVGCIGGWTDVLTKQKRGKAGETLGLTSAQEDALFMPGLMFDNEQGTPKHARKVVAHIKRFQKKYATQLRKKRV